MTATDEAIDAMAKAFTAKVKQHAVPATDLFGSRIGHYFGCSTDEALRVALAAVPDDVLARVAIERGALVPTGFVWQTSQGIQWGGPEGTGHHTEQPVYRWPDGPHPIEDNR